MRVDLKDASDSESESAGSESSDLMSMSELGDDFLSQYSTGNKISSKNVGHYEGSKRILD